MFRQWERHELSLFPYKWFTVWWWFVEWLYWFVIYYESLKYDDCYEADWYVWCLIGFILINEKCILFILYILRPDQPWNKKHLF